MVQALLSNPVYTGRTVSGRATIAVACPPAGGSPPGPARIARSWTTSPSPTRPPRSRPAPTPVVVSPAKRHDQRRQAGRSVGRRVRAAGLHRDHHRRELGFHRWPDLHLLLLQLPAGSSRAGASFTWRNLLQDSWGQPAVLVAIGAGTALTWLVAAPRPSRSRAWWGSPPPNWWPLLSTPPWTGDADRRPYQQRRGAGRQPGVRSSRVRRLDRGARTATRQGHHYAVRPRVRPLPGAGRLVAAA